MNGGIVAVVGMRREARIVGSRAIVCQRGIGLEDALRQGGSAVISFGACGALDPDLKVGDLVVGEGVTDGEARRDCDPAWTARLAEALPRARRGLIWADGRMIASVEQKRTLNLATGAVAADMESHIAAKAAAEFDVPFAIVRAVSDGARTAIPAAAQAAFAPDGSIDAMAVLKLVLASGLSDILELIPMARGAGRAFRALESAAPSAAFRF